MAKPEVVAGGCSQLEAGWGGQKVQNRTGQVPAQPSFQVCCSPASADDFLESRQQMPKRVRSSSALCIGSSTGRQVFEPLCLPPQLLLAAWASQEERKQLH